MGKQWEIKWTKKYLSPNTLLKEKYRISAVLGTGSFGITYLGMDQLLEQTVAIKEFFPSGIGMRDPEGKRVSVLPEHLDEFEYEKSVFKKEAENIFGLFDVTGICAVKDYFEENNTAYIIQEYLSGGTLKEYLEQRDGHLIPWTECAEMFRPVMEGLCHIHSRGIVHRDVSPDNLMFSENGELKLIDFGAATVKEAVKDVKLKEAYAPLEQYKATELIGPWSDIFALCAVMYQVLTGNKPIPAIQRVKKDRLAKISNYADIPQQAEDAILQGLSLDIQKRYFYIGNLMENLGMDISKERLLIGKTREFWGETWLKITTENTARSQKSGNKRLTYRQKKTIIITACTVAAILFIMFGGIKLYSAVHPEEALKYKIQRVRKNNERAAKTPMIINDSEDPGKFDRMKKALSPYKTGEEDGVYSYDVPKDVLKSIGLCGNGYMESGKFSVDTESMNDILTYCYDQKPTVDSEYYYGDVRIKDVGSIKTLASSAYSSISYSVINEAGKEISISVYYDPVDELISEVSLKGDIEDGIFFLKKIFPYFVPETYFTEEESDTLFAPSYEAFAKQEAENEEGGSTESVYLSNHALFRMMVMTSTGKYNNYIMITLKSSGYYW
ncbi:MAG: serine/threonine protein kinase [Lachnospiraceae bacterium]